MFTMFLQVLIHDLLYKKVRRPNLLSDQNIILITLKKIFIKHSLYKGNDFFPFLNKFLLLILKTILIKNSLIINKEGLTMP